MIKEVSRSKDINDKLVSEGKISYFNSLEYFEKVLRNNEELEEFRRVSNYKSHMSEVKASRVVLC